VRGNCRFSEVVTKSSAGLQKEMIVDRRNATSTPAGGGHATRGPRPRDITSQTRTRNAAGADATAQRLHPVDDLARHAPALPFLADEEARDVVEE
jgi:hypothetical protein